jgi:hypothetical protein
MPNVFDLFSVKGHWRAGMSRLQKYEDLATKLAPSLVDQELTRFLRLCNAANRSRLGYDVGIEDFTADASN